MRRIIAAKAKRDNGESVWCGESSGGATKLVLTTKWVVLQTHTHTHAHLLLNCFSSTSSTSSSSSCAPFYLRRIGGEVDQQLQPKTSLPKWSFFEERDS